MLVVKGSHEFMLALCGQADPHRAAVDARAGVMQKASFDELFDVI
jgi:hypothetical protein